MLSIIFKQIQIADAVKCGLIKAFLHFLHSKQQVLYKKGRKNRNGKLTFVSGFKSLGIWASNVIATKVKDRYHM